MYKPGISYIQPWFVCMVICTIIASMIFLFSLLNHAYISLPRQVLFKLFSLKISEISLISTTKKKCPVQMSHRSVKKVQFHIFYSSILGKSAVCDHFRCPISFKTRLWKHPSRCILLIRQNYISTDALFMKCFKFNFKVQISLWSMFLCVESVTVFCSSPWDFILSL